MRGKSYPVSLAVRGGPLPTECLNNTSCSLIRLPRLDFFTPVSKIHPRNCGLLISPCYILFHNVNVSSCTKILFFRWWIFVLFPVLYYFKQCCYELCCVHLQEFLQGIYTQTWSANVYNFVFQSDHTRCSSFFSFSFFSFKEIKFILLPKGGKGMAQEKERRSASPEDKGSGLLLRVKGKEKRIVIVASL